MHLKPIKEKINHSTKIHRPNTIWASDKSYPEAMLCKIARSIYMGCIVLGYAVFKRIHPKKKKKKKFKLIPTIGLCTFKYICELENMFLRHLGFFLWKSVHLQAERYLYNPILIFVARIGYHDHQNSIFQRKRDTVCWTIEATK